MTTLVIVGGLPGTGKSTIAEHAARTMHGALIAKDVVEATLWRSGIGPEQNSGWAGYELLSSLADAQLRVGGSVVLDSVAPNERIRSAWRDLASRSGARFIAIECVCSDERVHRSRVNGRSRNIPGWPELSWEQVAEVRSRYEPWTGDRLVLDAMRAMDENLAAAEAYVRT